MAELLGASINNGVVNGGAASRARAQDLIAKRASVSREALENLGFVVETHQEGFVFVAPQNAEEKIVGCVLFEFKTVPNAVGGIHQHADAQRKIRLFAEVADFL